MATAWYVCPYRYRLRGRPNERRNKRYVAMDDFTSQIQGRGGDWREIEIDGLGVNGIGQALVKVRAELDVLTTLNTNFRRTTGNPRAEVTTERLVPRYDPVDDEIKLDRGKRPVGTRFEDVDDNVRD